MAINVKFLADAMIHDHNILIMGPAGTGKTQSLIEATEKANLSLKYFSASTLDPYIDLVGLPVAEDGENGKELKMLRNKALDEVEVVFFDELNRAELKTLNAVFELIQFKSINGERLPKLKAVIAAMNPVAEGYEGVQDLDEALMDRFEFYLETDSKADPKYFIGIFGLKLGQALVDWHNDHDQSEGYVSPRRLEKIGHAWMTFKARDAIAAMLPPGGQYNLTRLIKLLATADKPLTLDADADIMTRINQSSQEEILKMHSSVEAAITAMTSDEQVKFAEDIAGELAGGMQPEFLLSDWSFLIKYLTPLSEVTITRHWSHEVFKDYTRKREQLGFSPTKAK